MSAQELADLLKRQDAELADWRTAHGWWEPRRHDVSAERYGASQACVGELADKLIEAWKELDALKARRCDGCIYSVALDVERMDCNEFGATISPDFHCACWTGPPT